MFPEVTTTTTTVISRGKDKRREHIKIHSRKIREQAQLIPRAEMLTDQLRL